MLLLVNISLGNMETLEQPHKHFSGKKTHILRKHIPEGWTDPFETTALSPGCYCYIHFWGHITTK